MPPTPLLSDTHQDPHSYPPGVAYLDGQYVPVSQAKISVLDWGFLHSDATYDTVHVWKGAFFRLDAHMDRFFQSLEKLRMEIPYNRAELTDILHNCVALSGLQDAYVEMLCTRGGSPTFSRDPRDAINRFMAFAVPFGSVANPEQMARGLHVVISDIVRISPQSIASDIKNYHWLDLVRGLYDAFDRGGETAMLLDTNGNIAEGPGFNVFVVKNGVLVTPDYGVLPGITRQTIFDLCADLQRTCTARAVSSGDLKAADEVFITSTAGGVMPVTKINGQPVKEGAVGPVTLQLKDHYWALHNKPEWRSEINYNEIS